MNNTALILEKIKEALRIRHNALDTTLSTDINAGVLELKRSGVLAEIDGNIRDDALIENAIRYYVMASENYDGKGQQYQQSFEKLRDSLAQSAGYRLEVTDEE